MSTRTATFLSMHMGSDARVECMTYSDSGPILCVDGRGMHLTLHVDYPKVLRSFDVDNARALVAAAQTYLAECERLYAQTGGQSDTTGAGSERVA